MKSIHTVITSFLLSIPLLTLALPARAAPLEHPQRIERGLASGRLTSQEAARLAAGQERLERLEDRIRADGIITRHERQHLRRAAAIERSRYWRQTHDRQHDFNHDGRPDRPRLRTHW